MADEGKKTGQPDAGAGNDEGAATGTADGPTQEPTPTQPPIDYSSALPRELQGKSPDEVRSAWSVLMDTVRMQGQQLERLTARGDKEPPPKEPAKDPKETIWDDPAGTIGRIIDERLASYGHVLAGVEVGIYADARAQLPGFSKYEGAIKEFLQANNAPVTSANLKGAYLMFKGNEAVEAEQKAARRTTTSERPTPTKDNDKPVYEFPNDFERHAWEVSGMSLETWAELRQEGPLEVDVPLEGKR